VRLVWGCLVLGGRERVWGGKLKERRGEEMKGKQDERERERDGSDFFYERQRRFNRATNGLGLVLLLNAFER
jgi:hypothetical protein